MAKNKSSFTSSLRDKLTKNTTLDHTATLSESKLFADRDMIPTAIPMINVAMSGRLDGGFTPGLTALAGPSKHFKTGFALLFVAAYFKKYPDAICLFYDSEFGTPQGYFQSFGIDMERVVHSPITDVEQLKFDIMTQLQEIGRDEHLIIIIDSIGNLASKKEVEDALEQKSVADMTRAKQLKSLFRMVTPHLMLKNIPMFVVNHTYKEIGLFPKDIMGGGTGPMYSSDTVWFLGRQQDKEGTETVGYKFVINVEKSRFVKEKSKILIEVGFDDGISSWSGLLEVALEFGFVQKPKNGWYQQVDMETGELSGKMYRESETNDQEFWMPILANKDFQRKIQDKYRLEAHSMIDLKDAVEELDE